MASIWNIICTAMILLVSGAKGVCRVDNFYDCNYIVNCEHHPTAIPNPNCQGTANVSFIVRYSDIETLTSGFFSSTNFDSRVRHFKCIASVWKNIDSSAFKYYSKVITVELSNIGIESIFSDAFVNLGYMQYLNLSNNKIEHLYSKSLALPLTPSLETLDLSRNFLESLSGNVFSSAYSLTSLYLNDNHLEILTDDCFYNLSNLTTLHLQNNNLKCLNMSYIHLSNLKYLNLFNNSIEKINGYETSRLFALEHLNLSSNCIEVIEGNSFSQMLNIQVIDLSNNKILSPIESFMFMNNKLLKYLDLYNNNVTTVKDNAFTYNSITYFNFERNNITGTINRSTFSGLENITSLNLSKQSIQSIDTKTFVDLVNVKYINLSKNAIQSVANDSFNFGNHSSLSILDMSYNNLSDLYFLFNLTINLTELYVNNNNLTILPENTLHNLKELISLDISNNHILVLEQNSLSLNKLQYLTIVENKLSGNITSDIFSPAPSLRYLDISNFNYTCLEENSFVDLHLLTKLNLSKNEIEHIHGNNFKGMPQMYSLDLSHNNLSEIVLNGSLDNLKAFFINNNKISTLFGVFSNKSEILYIDASYNNITNLTNFGFENTTSLRALHLSSNQIVTFNNYKTNALTKLSDLILGSNFISEINLTYFKNLVRVDLSRNNITLVNYTMFENLGTLQMLDLSNNKISALYPGSFQDLSLLRLLNLSGNSISNIRYGTFRGLNLTEVLDLSRNKVKTLDVYVFHECLTLKNLIIDYNFIKTIDVVKLNKIAPNLFLLSVGGNPISCKEIVRSKQLEESKYIQITSIDKVYREDNVHGILCGGENKEEIETAKEEITQKNNLPIEKESPNNILGLACMVLIIIIASAASAVFVFKYYVRYRVRGHSTLPLRHSNFSSTDCQSDLLS